MKEVIILAILLLLSLLAIFTLILIATMPPFSDADKYRCHCMEEYQPPEEI